MNNTIVIVREVTAAAVRQRCPCPWRRAAAAVTWAGAAVPARYLVEGTAAHHAHQDARAAFPLRPTGPSDVPHTLPYQSERQRDPGSPTSLVVLHTPHCRPVSARQRHSHPLQRSPPDRQHNIILLCTIIFCRSRITSRESRRSLRSRRFLRSRRRRLLHRRQEPASSSIYDRSASFRRRRSFPPLSRYRQRRPPHRTYHTLTHHYGTEGKRSIKN